MLFHGDLAWIKVCISELLRRKISLSALPYRVRHFVNSYQFLVIFSRKYNLFSKLCRVEIFNHNDTKFLSINSLSRTIILTSFSLFMAGDCKKGARES